MMPVTIAQLRATATVDLMTAARALGLGRTKAYELARRDEFPCRVIRIGEHLPHPHRRPAGTARRHRRRTPQPHACRAAHLTPAPADPSPSHETEGAPDAASRRADRHP